MNPPRRYDPNSRQPWELDPTDPTAAPETLSDYALHVGRGALMGAADIVPGVSGGTVALLVGIYPRLLRAITRFDARLFQLLRTGQFSEAATHLDAPFLLALGVGIAGGLLLFGTLVSLLLADAVARAFTLAAFFGLIFATGVLVARRIEPPAALHWVGAGLAMLVGAAVAFAISGWQTAAVEPSVGYLFVCGTVGICAMILPGVSGAMLLLILGVYVYLTDRIKELLHLQLTAASLLEIAAFALGCVVGLLTFTRLLRWLLEHYRWITLAVLTGFIFGALRKIWPFQRDLTPEIEIVKLKTFVNVVPEWSGTSLAISLTAVVAAAALLGIELALERFVRDKT